MTDLDPALLEAVAGPTPAGLWRLRADLLEAGLATDSPLLGAVADFHRFLDRVGTAAVSRRYSELASKMDIAALGGIVAEDLLEADDRRELATRLLGGGVSEGLAMLATRQHVRAWAGELAAVLREAAWSLYDHVWIWACRRSPEGDAAERRALVDRLLAPILADGGAELERALLIGRVYQLILWDTMRAECPGHTGTPRAEEVSRTSAQRRPPRRPPA